MDSANHGTVRRGRVIWMGFLAMGLLYPLIRFAVVLFGSMDRVRQDFADDAYYYALIAHNIAGGNGSTFGGIVPTNGYQPLWQLLLVPIATMFSGDSQIRLTFALASILFACFIFLAWQFSKQLGAYTEGLYAAVYAVTIGAVFGNQFFNGMEFALVVPAAMLVVLLLLQAPQHLSQKPSRATRYGVLLGLSFLLLALSRLDAVALPVAYAVVILLRRSDRDVQRALIVAAVVTAGGLIAYAAFNLLNYGTPVPVSGLAKGLGGGTWESAISFLRAYLEFGSVGPLAPMWLGLQATVVSALALWLLRRRRIKNQRLFNPVDDAALSRIIQALVLAQLFQLGYYAATTTWRFWEWYYYYIPLQFMVAGVVAVRALGGRWAGLLKRPPVVACFAALAAVASLALFVRDSPGTSWTTTSVTVGAWINRNTPPDAVIAMGDRAGGVLWASNRRTVQLEGLVEDSKYLSVLRSHTIPQHLVEQSVDYYVRASTAGDAAGSFPVPGRPGCWSFDEPGQGRGPKSRVVVCDEDLLYTSTQEDGSVWQIWSFRPELQDPENSR